MKNFLPYFLFVLLFLNTGCYHQCTEKNVSESENGTMISVVNWNVQTFFDAETSGNEYSEFQSSTRWSRDKYVERLKSLVDVIELLDADVYVFEEIENYGILHDIFNQLTKKNWNAKGNWNYGTFAADDNQCIGIGILSKYPVTDVKIHKLDIRTQNSAQPSSRPLLQAEIAVTSSKNLTILANHWKSKSGGEEQSEIWRDWQENLLSQVLLSLPENENYLVCGDFNRDINEFYTDFSLPEDNVLLRSCFPGSKSTSTAQVFSPWFESDGSLTTETGTYYYQKNWERIDNFFTYGKTKLSAFSPKADSPWADENGIPVSYKISTGEGYSDHLPIMTGVILR